MSKSSGNQGLLFLYQYLRNELTAENFAINSLSANPTKWLNTLKTIHRLLPTNCSSVFGHFVGLALKGLTLLCMMLKNDQTYFKGNTQFIFLCNSPKSSVNVCLMEILKSTVTKKVIVWFYNLGEENILNVATSVVFPTPIMVLFEIHQRFKGHFLNELRVSFENLGVWKPQDF